MGLAETQQILVEQGLRSRVALQVDGGLKTGRDVVIGALLGADEFGFATAPLVAIGCIMMRKCHLNTCPVGIATQDPGAAEALRRHAGARHQLPLPGGGGGARDHGVDGRAQARRADRRRPTGSTRSRWSTTGRARGLDFSRVFYKPRRAAGGDAPHAGAEPSDRRHPRPPADRGGEAGARATSEPVIIEATIRNVDRATGTMLSGEVAKRYGHEGLPDDTITVKLTGTAGQSFGAFLARGVTLDLVGDANDYVGKGLSGGRHRRAPAGERAASSRTRASSSATPCSTARSRASATSPASPASVSRCAIPAPSPSSRASATTAANT